MTRVDRGHEPDVFNYIYTNNAHLNRVGVEPDAMGLPPPFEFSYGLADVYIASLEVQYADGGTYSKKKLIEVNVGESDDEEEEPLDEGEDEGEDIDPPTAEFAGIPTSGEAPLIVTFNDQSSPGTGTITGWQWDFGDDMGTSSDQNPSHTYTDAGTYTVDLTATDDNALQDIETKPAYITVTLPPEDPPIVQFSVDVVMLAAA